MHSRIDSCKMIIETLNDQIAQREVADIIIMHG